MLHSKNISHTVFDDATHRFNSRCARSRNYTVRCWSSTGASTAEVACSVRPWCVDSVRESPSACRSLGAGVWRKFHTADTRRNRWIPPTQCQHHQASANKKLSCCRQTARCSVTVSHGSAYTIVRATQKINGKWQFWGVITLKLQISFCQDSW